MADSRAIENVTVEIDSDLVSSSTGRLPSVANASVLAGVEEYSSPALRRSTELSLGDQPGPQQPPTGTHKDWRGLTFTCPEALKIDPALHRY